jgi:phosphotransferase system  glucose/maltose/N-acetylglucosamine-specific IIC component
VEDSFSFYFFAFSANHVALVLRSLLDFLTVYSTLAEVVLLVSFTLSFVYYVIFTLLVEFLCFAQDYNGRQLKLEGELTQNFQLDGVSARLRAAYVCLVAYAYTLR